MVRWVEENPGRLEWELEQFKVKNWSFELDQQALQEGRVVLRGSVQHGDDTRQLTLIFPDSYPEHRVEIYDLTGDAALPMHEHPYQHNLCLLDNLPEAWAPNTDYAAWMVERVLELREAAEEGIEGLRRIGVGAPEPQSTYFPYGVNSSVLIAENILSLSGDRGWFRLYALAGNNPLHCVLSEVQAKSPQEQHVLAPDELTHLYNGPALRGPWFRLDESPPWLKTAPEFYEWAASSITDFARIFRNEVRRSPDFPDLRIRPFAFAYPDEGPEGVHDAWLVCLLAERREGNRWGNTPGALLRPFVLSPNEQQLRIPSLAGLSGKRVAIIGLGTIGAPVALELARIGLLGELLLVDYDHFSVWNLVRHPLDLYSLGVDKADAMAARIKSSAPFTETTVMKLRVGDASLATDDKDPTLEDLLQKLQGFDLVVDATADSGTSRFLNRFSLRAGIPLVVPSVTDGGWGGKVLRSIPGETGCYECYE